MRTRGWFGVTVLTVAVTAISIAAVACGSNDAASAFRGDDTTPSTGSDAASGGKLGDSPSAPTVLQQDAVLLVHAANAPAFRLCFESAPDLLPMPDATLMPAANVVGVEVGSAVRIDKVPNAAPGNRIWFFSEPVIRAIYGAGGASPKCGKLVGDASTAPLAILLPGFEGDLSTGIHILAVTGCAGSTSTVKHTKAECGDGYTGASTLAIKEVPIFAMSRQGTDRLPAQLIDLSMPLDLARGTQKLRVAYGDLTAPDESAYTELAADPPFGTVTPAAPNDLSLPSSAADFDKMGFRVSYVGDADSGTTKVADQSLVTINRLSAPTELPTDYYTTASSYLFMLLGSPAPAYEDGGGVDPDELRNVHMLAVPVYVPNFDAGTVDAGADAGGGSP